MKGLVGASTIPPVLPTFGPRTFLRVAQVTLGLVVLNIVSGAAVRLSDSGLGCPDWPTCSKHHLTPPLALHPFIEFSNRLVVVALSVAVIAVLLAALRRRPRRRDLTGLSLGLVGGIVGEIVIGAVVVYSKLNPYVVMVHFLVGIALLTVALVLVFRAGRGPGPSISMVSVSVRRLGRAMIAVLIVAIAAGTATTGAGPHAGGKGAKRIPVPLSDMARTHAEIVLVLGALTLAMLYLLDHTKAPARVVDKARFLLAVMVAQGIIGYTQYFTRLPAVLVGVHVFGAAVLWCVTLWFYDGLSHHPLELVPPDPAGADDGDRSVDPVAAALSRRLPPTRPAVASPVPLPSRRSSVGSRR
jgi:heme a synthase